MKNWDVVKDNGYELFQKLLSEKKNLIFKKIILDKKDNHKYPIENIPFNIPRNWYWCYLSDISIIQEGPGIRKHQYQDEGVQFLTVTNILEDAIDLEKSKKYISVSEYDKTYSHFTINKGDIVTACSGGSWGKSAIFEFDDRLILNTSTLRLRFYDDLGNNRYLYYLTKTSYFKDSLSSYITGQQPNYGYSHYSKIPIPLPPLSEQQHIVSILEECFAAIEKAKANAEQNLKNAKELFDCVLESILYDKKWQVEQLGNVCEKVEYGTSSKAKPQGELPVLRMGNIHNGRFVWNSLVYSDNEEDNKQYLLKHNDVLFNRTNSPELVGKTAIYKGEQPAIFAGYLIRIHRKENLLDADYLNYYLNSKMAFEYGKTVVISSVNQANINGTKLKTYPIPLPTIQEQQAIVRQLDALRAETKKLEAVYQKKIDDLEELKKSILQKAFAGELTTKEVVMA